MADARHYLAGVSTNFAFDDAIFALRSADPAIKAIREQLWLLYDDLREHRAKGAWQPPVGQREVVTRMVLFLKTDLEYRWPAVPAWYFAVRPIIRLVTLGLGVQVLDRQFEVSDSENVWPFRGAEEVRAAMREPRYLASAT